MLSGLSIAAPGRCVAAPAITFCSSLVVCLPRAGPPLPGRGPNSSGVEKHWTYPASLSEKDTLVMVEYDEASRGRAGPAGRRGTLAI